MSSGKVKSTLTYPGAREKKVEKGVVWWKIVAVEDFKGRGSRDSKSATDKKS